MHFQVCQITAEDGYSLQLGTASGALYLLLGTSGSTQVKSGKGPGKNKKRRLREPDIIGKYQAHSFF